MSLRKDAEIIISNSIKEMLPDAAVKKALEGMEFGDGRLILVAVGKAAWQMTECACGVLGTRIDDGICITKYEHSGGDIPGIDIYEAGHPVPDQNSVDATLAAVRKVENLSKDDVVLYLLSGGGSALFENPRIPLAQMEDITKALLASGADITEINTIRKRLSGVKGGRFAQICHPAKVFAVILSDVIGDAVDMIASGPVSPDSMSSQDAEEIVRKYNLQLSEEAMELIFEETPKCIDNTEIQITGSVREFVKEAARQCEQLGYEPVILTDSLNCEAREAGRFLGAIARAHAAAGQKKAFIAGGETIVHLTGKGKGGRNQEIAIAAAEEIAGYGNVAVFSVGSDGTDGPTDAAGGYVDGSTKGILKEQGILIYEVLKENDAYHALEKSGGLIITGATGTNVNDVAVVLVDGFTDF